jgi:ADP-heptose:LPS heptosyltransferase
LKILVIKHGALGDIILAFPAFAAIRAAHADSQIALLTTAPFAAFMKASPWFDEVMVDSRPDPWDVPGLLRLRRQLRGFDLVYDLQTSSRSTRYYTLAGKPRWSGIAPGCAFPQTDPRRDSMHTRERLADQLRIAGIPALPEPDLSWLRRETPKLRLPQHYAVLVPGASPHRPEKKWPEQKFGALAAQLPIPSAIVGSAAEAPLGAVIKSFAHRAIDLTGGTDLLELAAVISRAALAVGNDTGPMHLAAALGVPSVVLFSSASDPALTAPRYPDGGWPGIVSAAHLSGVSVAQVVAALP